MNASHHNEFLSPLLLRRKKLRSTTNQYYRQCLHPIPRHSTYCRRRLPIPAVSICSFFSTSNLLELKTQSIGFRGNRKCWRSCTLEVCARTMITTNNPIQNNDTRDESTDSNVSLKSKSPSSWLPPCTSSSSPSVPDPRGSRILTWIQQNPYSRLARWDKPIGTWLLFWPCAWSVAVATTTTIAATCAVTASIHPVAFLGQFAVGSILLRGAGCTINDLWDAHYDRKVARTATRPLAAGELSTKQAMQFAVFQLVCGASLLIFTFPHPLYSVQWGLASLPLVVMYPTAKRFFPIPQLILGLAMSWGVLMGYASYHGFILNADDPSTFYHLILPLYGSGVTWTLLYDTLYAHQDKVDDARLGLQSSALYLDKRCASDSSQRNVLYGCATVTYLQWLYVVAHIIGMFNNHGVGDGGMVGTDIANGDCTILDEIITAAEEDGDGDGAKTKSSSSATPAAYRIASIGGISLAYAHLLWQVQTVNFQSPRNCLERFQANRYVGGLASASFFMAAAIATAT